ncbi:MAG: glycoside hydrolase family 15 protein [Planctomycetaceae bacterium]
MPRPVRPELWRFLRQLADSAASGWREPDQGPWEMSGKPQHFLYSKLYCWVALDRAVRLAQRVGLAGDLQHWRREQEAIRQLILTEGYCEEAGAFTQSFGSTTLDASVLTMPLVGFLPATDPRMVSTTDRIRRKLGRGSLLYRYLDDDGLPGREGSFSLCSFWLVSNLALAGRVQEAREAFEQICGHANDLGLMGEEIDPASGELLGNFPQGFTHLGLVRAALHIAEAERA